MSEVNEWKSFGAWMAEHELPVFETFVKAIGENHVRYSIRRASVGTGYMVDVDFHKLMSESETFAAMGMKRIFHFTVKS